MCYTLEDEQRALKVKGETRIPAGTYNRTKKRRGFHARYDKKYPGIHRSMLHVTDVPGFEYILIHTGNTDEHTAGCLIVKTVRKTILFSVMGSLVVLMRIKGFIRVLLRP